MVSKILLIGLIVVLGLLIVLPFILSMTGFPSFGLSGLGSISGGSSSTAGEGLLRSSDGGENWENAALSKTARNDDAFTFFEHLPHISVIRLELLGINPGDLRTTAVEHGSGFDRLDDTEVGIIEMRVLPNDRDLHFA